MLSFLNNTKGYLSLIFLAVFCGDVASRADEQYRDATQFFFNYGVLFLILFVFTLFFKSESAKLKAFFIPATILLALTVLAFFIPTNP